MVAEVTKILMSQRTKFLFIDKLLVSRRGNDVLDNQIKK